MKKIDRYFIERFPLLWNLRIVYVLPLLLLLHLIFFLLGGASVNMETVRSHYRLNEYYFESGYILFGILLSVLVFVLWLLFYLRNNPLKKFYPYSGPKLLFEYILVLVICILNVSYYVSYNLGQRARLNTLITNESVQELKEVLRDAAPYVNSYRSYFDEDQYCAEEVVVNSYGHQEVSAEALSDNIYNASRNLRDSTCCDTARYSYYYFCRFPYTVSIQEQNECIRKHRKMLAEKDTASISRIVERFAAMQEKFGASTRLQTPEVIGRVFAMPEFGYEQELSSYENDSREELENIIWNVEHFRDRETSDFWLVILIHLFIGIMFSAFIFSFRLTNIKSWLIAIVGQGVLLILITVFNAVTGMRDEEFAFNYLFAGLVIAALAVTGCFVRMNKLISGAFLNAAMWNAPWFILLLATTSFERYYGKESGLITLFVSWITGLVQIALFILCARFYRAKPEE